MIVESTCILLNKSLHSLPYYIPTRCSNLFGKRDRVSKMAACFERASPALKEILLKIYRAEKPLEIDHQIHEFGSVKYHVRCSASDPHQIYLSVSMPLLSQGSQCTYRLPNHIGDVVKGICPDVVEIIEPPKYGYQLTLMLNFDRVPHGKVSTKIITEISTIRAVILSSQLKEMLRNVDSQEVSQGIYKPIKLIYHPGEPFYVIKQPAKVTAVFPMRFKENTDVIIATTFFQELVVVGSSGTCAKAPHCIWSPIPPPELRGEPIEDLSTNGGFVSFDITSRHVEGKKLDKTVWSLLNLYTFMKYHVKSTRGFMHRRMRMRLGNLVEILQNAGIEDQEHIKNKVQGFKYMRTWARFSRPKFLKRRYNFRKKLKRIRSRLKIHGFGHFRQRWLTIPKFSSVTRYTKLK